MALVNYSLPFGGISAQSWATISPIQQHATAVNNLLYGPAGHQESDLPPDQLYPNEPYAPPRRTTQQFRNRNNNYLPPVPAVSPVPRAIETQQFHSQSSRSQTRTQFQHTQSTRTYTEETYAKAPPRDIQPPNTQYYNSNGNNQRHVSFNSQQSVTESPPASPSRSSSINADQNNRVKSNLYPSQVPGFKRIQAGQGSRTQVHAILDYDDDEDDYSENNNESSANHSGSGKGSSMPTVTPIQGPIFIKNGSVPVVPLFSYPTTNNGSFVQIPIWWTALSVALGLELSGEVIHGTPCVKRNNQLYCPTAGSNYPLERIESFIDENKALMRRMYGDFELFNEYGPPNPIKNEPFAPSGVPVPSDVPGEPDLRQEPEYSGDSYFREWRSKRQTSQSQTGKNQRNSGPSAKPNFGPTPSNESNTGRVDACESKIEIVTPYWAANSAGKIRAIVNTQHFEQAIHQEVCAKTETNRCGGDCGCEQKYKWHRLLAYDPDNDCKGIFMDWFLFPSCCVCRCNP